MLSIDDMAMFCKRKGFVYQDSEIYGSMSGFWDFGPIGVELKNNIKQSWWQRFVHKKQNIAGLDGSIITSPQIWKASGHVDCFNDVLLECKKCQNRVRADHYLEEVLSINAEGMSPEDIDRLVKEKDVKCPKCKGDFEKGKPFNLMFETQVGPLSGNKAYLRPETAQLMFADFKLVMENARMKLPFGIAQQGKAFRNEISPREFLFRSREFEQMEIEFFVHPDKKDECPEFFEIADIEVQLLSEDMQKKAKEHEMVKFKDIAKLTSRWHAYWIAEMYLWFTDLGIKPENLRLREHRKDELAHYAGACFDIEYHFPFGWKEIHGNADRQTFDLSQHIKVSGKDMMIYDEESKQKVLPYVASEPSQGVERAFLAFMYDAYSFDNTRENIVLKLHPRLAPVKAAVFPLVNKEEILKKSKEIFDMLNEEFYTQFDKSGSVGRRYARNDEIGTPYCITIDFDSLTDNSVTIRDRDTTKQIRIPIDKLVSTISKLLKGKIEFEKAGKVVKSENK